MNKVPKWFEEWRDNDFKHMANRVEWNTRLILVVLSALICAAVANLFM